MSEGHPSIVIALILKDTNKHISGITNMIICQSYFYFLGISILFFMLIVPTFLPAVTKCSLLSSSSTGKLMLNAYFVFLLVTCMSSLEWKRQI